MIGFHRVADVIYDFLKRVYLQSLVVVAVREGEYGKIGDLTDGILQYAQLLLRVFGEYYLLIMYLFYRFSYVPCVVGHSLEVCQDSEVFADFRGCCFIKIGHRQLEQVVAEFIFIAVYHAFEVKYSLQAVLAVFSSCIDRTHHAFEGLGRHGFYYFLGLSKGERRVIEESRLELVHICLLFKSILPLREDLCYQRFEESDRRRQDYDYRKSVESVGEGYRYHAHLHGHEAEVDDGIDYIENASDYDGAEHINYQINKRGPLSVYAGAKSAEHYRN